VRLTRRAALGGAAGLAAVGLTPAAARASGAARRFTILRDGDDIGRHVIELTREGDRVFAAVDVEIVVRVLGIAAYRYEMKNREVWQGGRLQSIDSDVNDDGRRKTVRARREGGALKVSSAFFTGAAPDDVATTTYFTTEFLKRPTWISTDSGELYPMRVSKAGAATVEGAKGPIACEKWRATNGTDFDVELFYDARGEWASVAFDAGGERAIYRPENVDQSLAAVWAS
jgi:hypothetical protein